MHTHTLPVVRGGQSPLRRLTGHRGTADCHHRRRCRLALCQGHRLTDKTPQHPVPYKETAFKNTACPVARDCQILGRTGNCEKIPVHYFNFTDSLSMCGLGRKLLSRTTEVAIFFGVTVGGPIDDMFIGIEVEQCLQQNIIYFQPPPPPPPPALSPPPPPPLPLNVSYQRLW